MAMQHLKLDWCSHDAALYAVKHWHYSGCLPAAKLVKIGVWEEGRFVGCIIFSRGACHQIGVPYGLTQMQVCELTRVALGVHHTPVSRILSVAIKMLHAYCPGLRLVTSYADTAHNHHGGIYQACGWIHCGTSISTELYLNGKRRHRRSINSIYGTSKVSQLRARGIRATCITTQPKYRYLYPLDRAMREQVLPLAKPYPKRAGTIAVDGPAIHAGQGGSIPTPALQTMGGPA